MQPLSAMGIPSFQLYIIALHLWMSNQANAITGYTRRPLDGHFCRKGVYKEKWQHNRQACTRSCMISETGVLLINNPHSKRCSHLEGSQPYHQAMPAQRSWWCASGLHWMSNTWFRYTHPMIVHRFQNRTNTCNFTEISRWCRMRSGIEHRRCINIKMNEIL